MAINPITTTLGQIGAAGAKPPVQDAAQQVTQTFSNALDQLSETQNASDSLIAKLAAGENVELHQVMIAAEQTDINFRIAMAMRDKLVEAYQEVMRMQV